MEYVWFALIGLAAGFLAGHIMKGKDFGLVTNLIVGVIGALLGGFVCGLLRISVGGLLGALVVATLGAMLFLFLLKFIKTKM
jgi:uncharacterized membrane protein YeaQ/YmgE (transglycosylase-associated protein family)